MACKGVQGGLSVHLSAGAKVQVGRGCGVCVAKRGPGHAPLSWSLEGHGERPVRCCGVLGWWRTCLCSRKQRSGKPGCIATRLDMALSSMFVGSWRDFHSAAAFRTRRSFFPLLFSPPSLSHIKHVQVGHFPCLMRCSCIPSVSSTTPSSVFVRLCTCTRSNVVPSSFGRRRSANALRCALICFVSAGLLQPNRTPQASASAV